MVIDVVAARLGEKFSRIQSQALVIKSSYEGHHVILAKPRTFMNRSGLAIGALSKFYKIPLNNILVIYDEVDLPLDTIRIRGDGSSAGHKGMHSIIERLGTQTFPRLRIGIGRPQGKKSAPKHVLQDFSKDDLEVLPFVLSRAADAALAFMTAGIDQAMTTYNKSPQ
jgi:PTH1 family peptidyl-tRNA hydrolase